MRVNPGSSFRRFCSGYGTVVEVAAKAPRFDMDLMTCIIGSAPVGLSATRELHFMPVELTAASAKGASPGVHCSLPVPGKGTNTFVVSQK